MQGGGQQIETPEQEVQAPQPVVEKEPIIEAQEEKSDVNTINQDGCRRWQVEVEECEGIKSTLELSGTVLVTDDGWGIAEEFCILLDKRGINAIRIGFESDIRDMSMQKEGKRVVYRADPGNPEHLSEVCENLSNENISGIVHMAALKLAGVEWLEDTNPSSQVVLSGHGWFSLSKN